jgi:hypothetical protein
VRRLLFLSVFVAGCSQHDPREDAILFDHKRESVRRHLLALFAFGDAEIGFGCIHIERKGVAEVHFEPGPALKSRPLLGKGDLSRHAVDLPVAPAEMEAIERILVGLPEGVSTWAVIETQPRQEERICPAPRQAGSMRYRALYVPKTGVSKEATIYHGPAGTFPKDARLAEAELAGLLSLLIRITNPGSQK